MFKKPLLLLAAALFASAAAAQETPVWYADFDAALAAAKEAKKDLLVDFTGSDWCGWCMKLDKEVFDHESFLGKARESYVLVKLDFPQGEEAKARVPNPKRNDELSSEFGIGGFPTILLVSAEGDVFGRTGYQEGGPDAYLKHMGEIAAEGRKELARAKELETKLAGAEGDAALAVVTEAIERLESAGEGAIGLSIYARLARRALTLDADDAKGLKTRAFKALLESNSARAADLDAIRTFDAKNEKGLLEQVVQNEMGSLRSEEEAAAFLPKLESIVALGIKDAERKEFFIANAAFFAHRFAKDEAKAKKYARMLKEMPELNPRLQQLVDMILGSEEEKGEDGQDG